MINQIADYLNRKNWAITVAIAVCLSVILNVVTGLQAAQDNFVLRHLVINPRVWTTVGLPSMAILLDWILPIAAIGTLAVLMRGYKWQGILIQAALFAISYYVMTDVAVRGSWTIATHYLHTSHGGVYYQFADMNTFISHLGWIIADIAMGLFVIRAFISNFSDTKRS